MPEPFVPSFSEIIEWYLSITVDTRGSLAAISASAAASEEANDSTEAGTPSDSVSVLVLLMYS